MPILHVLEAKSDVLVAPVGFCKRKPLVGFVPRSQLQFDLRVLSNCGISSNAKEQIILWQIKMGVQSVQGHVLSTEIVGKTDRNGLGYFSRMTPPEERQSSALCVPACTRTEPGDAMCCPAALQLPA